MSHKRMMGFDTPGDRKVSVTVRDWNAMKLACWRSKGALETAAREAIAILNECAHADGCPALEDDTRPCIADRWEKPSQADDETEEEYTARPGVRVQVGCVDRELRMSALVILNAARTLAPVDARRSAADPYMAPSREYFSEVLSTLGAAQIEVEILREALRAAGLEVPTPVAQAEPMLTERAPPPQLST